MATAKVLEHTGTEDMFGLSDELSSLSIWNFESPVENAHSHDPVIGNIHETLAQLETSAGKQGVKEGLVVLFSTRKVLRVDADQQRLGPMSMTKESFDAISDAFSLSRFYICMHSDTSPMFVDEVHRSPDGIQRFLMQINYPSTLRWSFGLSYDPIARITKALVHGLLPSQIPELAQTLISRGGEIGLPMLLPSILLASRVASASSKINQCNREIVDWERQTGLRPKWHADRPVDRSRHERANLGQALAELTSIISKLRYVEYLGEFHTPMLDKLDHINQRSLQEGFGHDLARLREIEIRLREENEFFRVTLQGAAVRAKYLTGRAQAQVQTIYSLIAQRDSAMALKDNAVLKAISEDQRKIALAATQDSAAMKIISAITAVFLPATFTSTFFSSSFFDFHSDASETVSRWIWLYAMVTILLSVLVLGWWYVTWRRKKREIELGLRRSEESEVGNSVVSR